MVTVYIKKLPGSTAAALGEFILVVYIIYLGNIILRCVAFVYAAFV